MKKNYPDLVQFEDGDFLVFEDHEIKGKAHYIGKNKIKNIIQEAEDLQLVIVTSCHSENTAKVFKDAGVKHVIAIQKSKAISD